MAAAAARRRRSQWQRGCGSLAAAVGQLGGRGGSLAEAQLWWQRQQFGGRAGGGMCHGYYYDLDDGLQEGQATKRKKNDNFLYDTLHVKRSLKYYPVLSGKTLQSFIRVVLGAPQCNNLRCELERSLAFVPAGRSMFLRDATKMLRFGPQPITFFGARSPCRPSSESPRKSARRQRRC